jgi:hypothetical protein
VTVYADADPTKELVSKPKLRLEPGPSTSDYTFNFDLSASNPNKAGRDHAGYIPGTYTFSFAPSGTLRLSGRLSDPHKHITGDDSQWTADVQHPEEAETTEAASAGG